nr:HAD-IA family hydrolase [Enterococcus hulanensis]
MYLCRNTITGILKKANILDFDKIYISSEIDKTKRRGTMYREIKKDNPDARIVHVGDNKKSDYFKAKENKLNAILIETETSYLRYSKLSESPILSSFINNRIKNDNNWYYQFGFETFGPILAGFTKWLSNELKIKNYDKIFFLSRDGSIMMKAFEIMCIDVEIPYTYLYGSRRGYIVPSLQSYSSITEMLQNVFTGKIFTINDLLPKLGLSRDILTEEQKRVTERIFNGLDEMYADNEALKLLKKLENQVIENSKVEFERIGKYLKQNDFSGNIAIIDIGWFGNIQHALSRIIGDKAQITGYYIGIHPKSKQVESEKLNGFLFEKGKNEEFQRIIQSFSNIFELLFTSDEGTLINFYEKKDGIVAPNLADFEYSDTNELELIRNIQKGALDFVKAFSDFEYSEFVDVSEVKVFSAIKNFAIKPKMEDVLRFGDLSFADGEVSNYIAKPKSFLNYIVKPKSFIYDMKKSWQAGFFLRLFKIPFPYYSLTEKIKRVRRDKKIGVRSE